MHSFTVTYGIVGTGHYDYHKVYHQLALGDDIRLSRDPQNQYDPRAIAVYHPKSDSKLGYIPRASNELLAQMMDAGFHAKALLVEHRTVGHPDARMRVLISLQDEAFDVSPEAE